MAEHTTDQFHFETVAFPPDTPVVRVPLRGAVELAVESEYTPDTPEAQATAFLDANADIFAAVDEAWRQVKKGQVAYQTMTDEFRGTSGATAPPREVRRRYERVGRDLVNSNVVFGTSKYEAAKEYPNLISALPEKHSLEENHEAFVRKLAARFNAQLKAAANDSPPEETPELIKSFIKKSTESQLVLVATNLYAQFRQDIALQKINRLLQNNVVAPAFVEQLSSLASSKESQDRYPGLLELLATHVEQEKQKNMLLKAILGSSPEPSECAYDFLQSIDNGQQRLPKELSAALGVMKVSAQILESEFSFDRQDFLRLFAERYDTWPPELSARLQEFVAGKNIRTWTELEAALKPFVREGRLPAEVNRQTIDTSPKRTNRNDRGRQVDNSASRPRIVLANRGVDYQDLVTAGEREPVSSFAVLTAKGDKAGKIFSLEAVDTVEEVVTLSNLDDYADRHSSDPTVRVMLQAAVEHLRRNPKDPAHTVTLKGVEYVLESDSGRSTRTPRRFSPQHFPGVSKGPTATKTRIIYDILNHNGAPTLVIYGAFVKGDIEQMSKMPSIR